MLASLALLLAGMDVGPGAAIARGADVAWVARLTNGETLQGKDLGPWNEAASRPQLAGRDLFESSNPIRELWRTMPEASQISGPTSYVEYKGGDRLAGVVIGYGTGEEWPYEMLFPHLLVKTSATLSAPHWGSDAPARVLLSSLRKVVWQPESGDRFEPLTAWLRGGGQIRFRSLRWARQQVTLLTAEGLRNVPFDQLAEIHFTAGSDWTDYEAALAVLSPELQSTLVQITSDDGSRYTVSTERFQARHDGDRNKNESWLQVIQPAWSLDPLWLRFPSLHSWVWFEPVQVPLSVSLPESVDHQSVFGGSWNWRRDASVTGEPLQVAGQSFLKGFGVHGQTELTFSLPPYARSLRTQAGLHHEVGDGGSVRLLVKGGARETLFQSEPVVGTSKLIDTGWLPRSSPSSTDNWNVSLASDMLATDAPQGADPFDIRDLVDWLGPEVQIERDGLQAKVSQVPSSRIAALQGWTVTSPKLDSLRFRNWLDESDHRLPAFRLLWSSREPCVLLSRTIRVRPEDRWLSLVVSRFEQSSQPTQIQVKLDGKSLGELPVPVRQGPIDPQPLIFALPAGSDRAGKLEVVVYVPSADCWIDWRGLVVSAERPGLQTVVSGESKLPATTDGVTIATPVSDPGFFGRAYQKISVGRVEAGSWQGLEADFVDLPRLGQFRFLVISHREQGASWVWWLAHQQRLGAEIAAGLGLGVPAVQEFRHRYPGPQRLEERGVRQNFAYGFGINKLQDQQLLGLDGRPSPEWKVETRDVVQDFGPIRLTGFAIDQLGEESIDLGALVLARTPQDVEWLKRQWLPAKVPAEVDQTYLRKVWQEAEFGEAIASFAAEFATAKAGHGLQLKREHQGQTEVWQTHPNDRDQPFVLRTAHDCPPGRPQVLDLMVSNLPGFDFVLQVRVNGQVVQEATVNDDLTKPSGGWANLQADLSPFQGQTILLEVQQRSNDWSNDYAFWKHLTIRDR